MVAYSQGISDLERLPLAGCRAPILTVHPSQHRKALFWRPPLAHRRFDSASLLPRKERGVHGETFDRMSFKFGATWRERYFAWLVWSGNPSPLPLHRTSLIACHSEQSSSSIIVKASKESRSRPVACNEVGAFYTEAGGCDHRSAERGLNVVLNFCLGLYFWKSPPLGCAVLR